MNANGAFPIAGGAKRPDTLRLRAFHNGLYVSVIPTKSLRRSVRSNCGPRIVAMPATMRPRAIRNADDPCAF